VLQGNSGEVAQIEGRDIGAEAFGDRHDDGVDESEGECPVRLQDGVRGGEVVVAPPPDGEDAGGEIGEPERVLAR
jgi:hypothetical protein